MIKYTSFRTVTIDIRTIATGFYSGRERCSTTLNKHGQVGIYGQGKGWKSVDEKLLRGYIKNKGRF